MKSHNTQKGFSIVETIIIIALFTMLELAIITSITILYKTNAYTIAQAYQVLSARKGVESLVRDLREMTYGDEGAYPLVQMGDNTVAFYSDIDRDDSVEFVVYELNSATLKKRVYNATGSPPTYSTTTPDETFIISEYVQNINQSTSTFRYYDTNGSLATPTTTVSDIRFIEMTIIVNVDPVRDPGEFMLRSSTALRNLKSDY